MHKLYCIPDHEVCDAMRPPDRIVALLATMLAFLAVCSQAQAFCMQPSAPYCASNYGEFDDEWEFDRCKREMENYQSELESFTQCHQREVDQANDEAEEAAEKAQDEAREAEEIAQRARNEVEQAVSEYNDAVRDFNRRAGGY